MQGHPNTTVSNRRADSAGEFFRRYFREEEPVSREELDDARRVLLVYRDMHAYPMTKVTLGVASMVKTATRNPQLRPGQRHKRMNRILVKLLRQPTMRLSQMEDIGGCRIVLPSLEEVYSVSERIMHRWRDRARLTDYIEHPKEDGYRGLHIIERRDGRLIEVQLRTIGQHDWAQAIEDFGPITGHDLKDGEGPEDLRYYFHLGAERIARHERGEAPDTELEAEFALLREEIRPYFVRG